MGVVKLHLPRFIYHRQFLPSNRNWRRNVLVGIVQIPTLAYVFYTGMSRWQFQSPKMGKELIDDNATYYKAVRLL